MYIYICIYIYMYIYICIYMYIYIYIWPDCDCDLKFSLASKKSEGLVPVCRENLPNVMPSGSKIIEA